MSKLQAKDFMIGDYVQVVPSMMPIKVAAVHSKKIAYHACTTKLAWVRSEWIIPIPLTAEILEKNGWESYSHENTPIYGMIQGFEIVLAWMDYYWQLCVDGTIYRKIKIRYVHELQQELKLCGIEKEIKI